MTLLWEKPSPFTQSPAIPINKSMKFGSPNCQFTAHRKIPKAHFELGLGSLGLERGVYLVFWVFLFLSLFCFSLRSLLSSCAIPIRMRIVMIPILDVELNLGRFVLREIGGVGMGRYKMNRLFSGSKASEIDSSSMPFPVKGNVYPYGDLIHFTNQQEAGKIVPPKDSLCLEVQKNLKSVYCDTCKQCDYEIEYADHSSSMGVLVRDELNLMSSKGLLSKPNVVFGCAYDQQGTLLNSLAKTDGILGLSRSKVSFPAQLASRGIVKNVFGHCLTSDIAGGGYAFIGDELVPYWNMAWVPMISNLSVSFYETEVARISYGGKKVSLAQ